MKKILALLLTLTMIMSFAAPSFAVTEDAAYASKKAKKDAGNEKYTITLSVPGDDYKTRKDVDEYIIMMDSSISNAGNYDTMIESIETIGEEIWADNDSSKTIKLTIMDFGVNAYLIGSYTSYEELEEEFLTRGREYEFWVSDGSSRGRALTEYDKGIISATNIEGAFSFMTDYLEKPDASKNVDVVFLSDMICNTVEKPKDTTDNGFDLSHWNDSEVFVGWKPSYVYLYGGSSFPKLGLADALKDEYRYGATVSSQILRTFNDNGLNTALDAYESVLTDYGFNTAQFNTALTALETEITRMFAYDKNNTANDTNIVQFYDALLPIVYEEAGMTFGNGNLYETSQIISAFISYYQNYFDSNAEVYSDVRYDKNNPATCIDRSYDKIDGVEVYYDINIPVLNEVDAYNALFCNNPIPVLGMALFNGGTYSGYYNEVPTRSRTIDATNDLAKLGNVNEIKMVRCGTGSEIWANPDATTTAHIVGDKFTYIEGTASAIYGNLSDIVINTDMSGAYIEDPMSEYVNIDESSIKIYQDDVVIYENGDWKSGVTPPYTGTPYTLLNNVLTWHVKDGVIASDDNFKLTYDVSLKDEYKNTGKSYPANGETILNYTSVRTNAPKSKSLKVPSVGQPYYVDISNAKVGAEYNVYKIFDVTYDGNGGFAYTYTSDTYDTTGADALDLIVKELEDSGMMTLTPVPGTDTYVVTKGASNDGTNPSTTATPSDDKTSNYALELQELNKEGMFELLTPCETVVAESNHIVIDVTNDGAGYYFVTTTNGSFVLVDTTDNTAYVQEKTEDPTVDKVITNTVNSAKDDDFALGDTVNYDVTVHAKPGAINYKTVDVCPLGLTLDKSSITLKIGNNTLAASNYTLTVTDATETTGSIITIAFDQDYLDTITADTDIHIIYNGVANDKAIAGANPNTVTLTWGASSEFSDDATDEFYTAEYKFVKVDQNDHTKTLQGVQFKIYNAATNGTQLGFTLRDGIYYYDKYADANVLTTDANGIIHLDLLEAGDYYLEEISTLPGYNLPTGRTKISIAKGTAYGIETAIYVENSSGVELPSTGGIGTKIFIGIGLLAVLAAGVFLLSNKRMSKEDF